ncbi:bacterio-opsin activator domain-containing protein [Haladaptatus sp. NG-SE-30]
MAPHRTHRDETVELEFSLHDQRCFFVAASDRAECELVGEEALHRTDGNVLEYFSVRGASPETVLDIAEELPTANHGRTVTRRQDEDLMEFVVTGPCVAATLADTEAVIKRARAVDGRATVVADVPPHGTVREVVETFETKHPDSSLVAKRTLGESVPALSDGEQTAHLLEDLTEKQRAAVETAVQCGYLAWPRESTATECAEVLGVSQPTFSQHLWTGVEKLSTAMFDETGVENDGVSNDESSGADDGTE